MKNIPQNIKETIQKFTIETQKLLGERVKKVILYGSYARGDYNSDSDIDIMILTDLTDDEIDYYRRKISELAYDIDFENNFDIMLSPVIKNIEKFNYWLNALPFYMNVQKGAYQICTNVLKEEFKIDETSSNV